MCFPLEPVFTRDKRSLPNFIIGLTIGLQGFNNDSAEAMMNTMKPLIEGIKVAFLTSIYGMILSLGYNIFY